MEKFVRFRLWPGRCLLAETKVRINPQLHAKLREIAEESQKSTGISQTSIADEAIEAWLWSHGHLGTAGARRPQNDKASTPRTERERAYVIATLAFLRDNTPPREFREILTVLLRRWMPADYREEEKTA